MNYVYNEAKSFVPSTLVVSVFYCSPSNTFLRLLYERFFICMPLHKSLYKKTEVNILYFSCFKNGTTRQTFDLLYFTFSFSKIGQKCNWITCILSQGNNSITSPAIYSRGAGVFLDIGLAGPSPASLSAANSNV